jgi:hypothetical protein
MPQIWQVMEYPGLLSPAYVQSNSQKKATDLQQIVFFHLFICRSSSSPPATGADNLGNRYIQFGSIIVVALCCISVFLNLRFGEIKWLTY